MRNYGEDDCTNTNIIIKKKPPKPLKKNPRLCKRSFPKSRPRNSILWTVYSVNQAIREIPEYLLYALPLKGNLKERRKGVKIN